MQSSAIGYQVTESKAGQGKVHACWQPCYVEMDFHLLVLVDKLVNESLVNGTLYR